MYYTNGSHDYMYYTNGSYDYEYELKSSCLSVQTAHSSSGHHYHTCKWPALRREAGDEA